MAPSMISRICAAIENTTKVDRVCTSANESVEVLLNDQPPELISTHRVKSYNTCSHCKVGLVPQPKLTIELPHLAIISVHK